MVMQGKIRLVVKTGAQEPKELQVPYIKQDFKLAIKLQRESSHHGNPSIEIFPTQMNGVQHFVMQWTKFKQPMVEFVFSIDEIDNLINWFLLDRTPCRNDDTFMDIYTVASDKYSVFNDEPHKVYGKQFLGLSAGNIAASQQKFKRALLNCACMSINRTYIQ